MERNTLNFRVGKEFPCLLGEIAQEKLVYELDPDKAINTFKESLSIDDEKIIFHLLSGKEYCLDINVDNQEIILKDRKDCPDSDYPILESEKYINNWLTQSLIDYNQFFNIFSSREKDYINKGCPSIDIHISLGLKTLINILSNHINEIKDEVYSTIINRFEDKEDEFFYSFAALGELLVSCKTWFIGTLKKINVIKFISASNIYELTKKNKIDLFNLQKGLGFLYNRLTKFMKSVDLNNLLEEYQDELFGWLIKDDEISSFLDCIAPSDPEIGCDAAWISPEGKYYGMNGEMDTMLHNQIADLLYKEGIIPKDQSVSRDYWLEMNGWVKLHNDWVLFEPFDLDLDSGKCKVVRNITEPQLDVLCKYGNAKYNGILRFGYLHTRINVERFKNELDNVSRNMLFRIDFTKYLTV